MLRSTSRPGVATVRRSMQLPEALREMVAHSPDGLALTEGPVYVYVNRAFANLLGVPEERLVGCSIAAYMPEEDRASLHSWRADPERATAELRFVHADGSPRVLELTPLRRLLIAGRSSEGFIARDVTRKRRVQADLLVADRMMSIGALAAGVAHDINNPLSYVLGNLDFLRNELDHVLLGQPLDLSSDLREAVIEAYEGAERVRRIVSDLRAFARIDVGTVRELDPVRVVESAVNMAFVEIRHRARLEKALSPIPPVRANEARLGQVVLNLLLNSVHAMREGQQEKNSIRVATWSEDDRACIEVSDNGPGIPPELVGRIFDPFFTTKPRGVGTGLGLAMVHGVVTELGGTIAIDSRLGEGTRFVVRLPTAQALDERPLDPQDTGDLELPQGRLLVIDDDPLILGILRRTLAREGHTIEVEEGGQAAIDRLEKDADFDLILCDLLMPRMSGMDVHAWMRRRRPELADRVIFMSGGVSTESVGAFLGGLDAPVVIHKPFEVGALTKVVRKALRQAQGACG